MPSPTGFSPVYQNPNAQQQLTMNQILGLAQGTPNVAMPQQQQQQLTMSQILGLAQGTPVANNNAAAFTQQQMIPNQPMPVGPYIPQGNRNTDYTVLSSGTMAAVGMSSLQQGYPFANMGGGEATKGLNPMGMSSLQQGYPFANMGGGEATKGLNPMGMPPQGQPFANMGGEATKGGNPMGMMPPQGQPFANMGGEATKGGNPMGMMPPQGQPFANMGGGLYNVPAVQQAVPTGGGYLAQVGNNGNQGDYQYLYAQQLSAQILQINADTTLTPEIRQLKIAEIQKQFQALQGVQNQGINIQDQINQVANNPSIPPEQKQAIIAQLTGQAQQVNVNALAPQQPDIWKLLLGGVAKQFLPSLLQPGQELKDNALLATGATVASALLGVDLVSGVKRPEAAAAAAEEDE